MNITKHLMLLAVMATALATATAQVTTSPYSKQGFGLLGDNASGIQRQMGGVGYAMQNGRAMNVMNPASYSQVDSLTFLWDVGLDLNHSWAKEEGKRGYNLGGGLDYLTAQFRIAKHLGGSLGLVPYSTVGYTYKGTIDASRIESVKEHGGHGIVAVIDDCTVIVGNEKLLAEQGIKGMFCHSHGSIVHVAVDGAYFGHIVIRDMLKPTSVQAVQALHQNGVRETVMLTGDREEVAREVADELGITDVQSGLLPEDKVRIVEEMMAKTKEKEAGGKHRSILAFVGDGINDAPVLARADVGVAMGALGADAAIEAADIVLMDDDPLKIAEAIRISRKCMRIVRENIVGAIGIKVLVLVLSAIGMATMELAIFADVGVMILAVLNAMRALRVNSL